ncbi:hypothetical protein FACS18949_09020 [Clostridia bacterium]|nr:hypothetical protein FACS18949_09020 [Clostridia bacterium]
MFRKRLGKETDLKETEKKRDEMQKELEKGDVPAIVLAAMITLLPAVAVPIGLLLLVYFLFMH